MVASKILPTHSRLILRHRLRDPNTPNPRRRSHHGQPSQSLLRRTNTHRTRGPTPTRAAIPEDVLHLTTTEPSLRMGDEERGTTQQGSPRRRPRVRAREVARTTYGARTAVADIADGRR